MALSQTFSVTSQYDMIKLYHKYTYMYLNYGYVCIDTLPKQEVNLKKPPLLMFQPQSAPSRKHPKGPKQ